MSQISTTVFAPREGSTALSVARTGEELGVLVNQARRAGGVIAGWRIAMAGNKHGVKLVQETMEQYFVARRAEMEYSLALGLDAAKKRLIANNLQDTAVIEREIARMTAVLTEELKNQVLDVARNAALDEVKRVRELEAAMSRGEITKQRFEKEVARIESATDQIGDRAQAVAERVIVNLGERLEAALRTSGKMPQ